MAQLMELVHSFANAFSSVDQLMVHREGLATIRRLLAAPALHVFKVMLLGNGDLPDVDMDAMFDDFGDLQVLIHTYHSRFIPEGVAEASQILLRDAHVLPKLLSCEEYCRCEKW
jgi:hypothetical protein